MANKPKLYLETTVLSSLTAQPSSDVILAARQQMTNEWWEERINEFEVFISELVSEEATA
ncbi:MAG: hypothetical protein H8E20_13365 [Verrucomicrobia bacterium]|nr:hypothetical protein [Verrucomicrobiota bacterium]